ncbi:ABC transporter ATP-binding protein [Actinophytocola glycyrrhizae]|uniref:ABC transporter ATP-binding protein n=1 Tax=Actinophytocola glycyrrhizae TaxID=2044873 RepID=A0ABV9RTT4_9PSEU
MNPLRVVDLHKAFRGRPVLSGIEFELQPGELFGIIGENGAGKSTLLRILAGELPADRGDIIYAGTLGYCPQNIVLNDDLTVEQHLRFFQRAYRLPGLLHAHELVERLGFDQHRGTRAGLLSGGTRQKLNLTIALMHDPDIVLMDEPYQGFDWDNYLNFWDIAGELRDRGRTVLIISHIAHDIERFDRLRRLRDGQLDESAVIEEVTGA